MPFGVVDKIYHEDFLLNQPCQSCGSKFENKLIIYCKAFMTGPVTWWAWGKCGYAECVSCGTLSDIHPSSKEFKEARFIYSRKATPLRYYIPSIVVGGVIGLVFIGLLVVFLYNISTSNKQKLQGIWSNTDGSCSLFVFEDNQFTLMESDTIIFGNYKEMEHTDKWNFNICGQDNIVEKVDLNDWTLAISSYSTIDFSKNLSIGKGDNPYDKRFNKWRTKANHDETKQELKHRALDYLNYLKIRYQWALTNNLTYLPADVYSPVLQAQNGIGIYEASVQLWKPLFYSKDNWITASRFLYQSFPRNHHINDKEKNVFKRNLEAIDAYIESAKQMDIQ